MPNTTPAPRTFAPNLREAKLPSRLRDLAGWVDLEFTLPHDEQVIVYRLDQMVRHHLGEFAKRARARVDADKERARLAWEAQQVND